MSDKNLQGDSESDEPKLIIDEDWKTQVQREKEQLKHKQAEKATPSDASPVETGGQSSEASQASEASQDKPPPTDAPPPASFEFLVSGIATQAVAAMGQLPDEEGKPLPMNLDYARHYIDLLGVIETKTQGNLTDHEQRFLQDTLHQLRLLFVAVKNS